MGGSVRKACMEISDVDTPSELKTLLEKVKISTQHKSIAKKLCSVKTHIIIGLISQLRNDSSQIISLCNLISIFSKSSVGMINFDSNSSGAWLTGCIPHRLYNGLEIDSRKKGLNFSEMIQNKNNLWLINNIEIEDCSNSNKFEQNLAASFVINLSSFDSEKARALSDILLPIATNYEIDGTFVNCFGLWQKFKSSIPLLGKSKKGWKVIKTIGNYLGLEGFKYNKIEDVNKDIDTLIEKTVYKNSNFKLFLPNISKNESKKKIFI